MPKRFSDSAVVVLQELARAGSLRQADIIERSGLARATVSSVVNDLNRRRYVRMLDSSEAPRGPGRPARVIALSERSGRPVGIDIGHKGYRLLIAEPTGAWTEDRRHLVVREVDVDAEGPDILASVATDLKALLRKAGANPTQIRGIGLGIPAPVDHVTGRGSDAVQSAWARVDVKGRMQDLLAAKLGVTLDVRVENDARLGALGHLSPLLGGELAERTFLYVKLSDGIGAALVDRGQLYRGPTGAAVELGHVPIVDRELTTPRSEPDERPLPECPRCRRVGCLESVASGSAIMRTLRSELPEEYAGRLAHDVIQDVRDKPQGHPRCVAALENAGRHVGGAIASLANALDIDHVVVGGILADAGEVLMRPVRDQVLSRQLRSSDRPVQISTSLNRRVALYGAIELVMREVPPRFFARDR